MKYCRALLLLLPLSACTGGETYDPIAFNDAHAEIIRVRVPSNASVPLQSLTPSLVLGAERHGKDDLFGSIYGVTVASLGQVYVLDAMLSQVVQFQSDGAVVRVISHAGDGPGEIRDPHSYPYYTTSGIALMHDSLHILGKFLYTFDTAGAFIRNSPSWVTTAWEWNGLAATDSGLIIERELRNTLRDRGWTIGFTFRTYLPSTGQILSKPLQLTFPIHNYGGNVAGTMLLSPEPVWAISHNARLYHVEGDSFDIVVQAPGGEVERRYLASVPRVRTNRHDVDEALNALDQFYIDGLGQHAPGEVARRMRPGAHAKYRAAIGKMIVSDESDMLLLRPDVSPNAYAPHDGERRNEWQVWSQDGELRGRYALPVGFIPKAFRQCQLYGTSYGTDDKPIVVRYDLDYGATYCKRN